MRPTYGKIKTEVFENKQCTVLQVEVAELTKECLAQYRRALDLQ